MRCIAFDIETEPNQDKLAELDAMPVKTDSRLKDPVKIENAAAEQKAKRREKAALSPFFGRAISWHTAMEGADGKVVLHSEFRRNIDELHKSTDVTEARLIQDLADFLEWYDGDQIVTYYGASFDVPFLQRRTMILNGTFPAIETGKYRVMDPFGKHLDVFAYLTGYNPDPLGLPQNLTNFANWLLGEKPPFDEHAHKTEYATWFREGNLEPLKQAGEWDALMTYRLGAACRQLGGTMQRAQAQKETLV